VANYRGRVSGPLRDRFDLQVEVPALPGKVLADGPPGDPSSVVGDRVAAARRIQEERFAGTICRGNATLTPELLRGQARVDDAGRHVLGLAMKKFGLSARAHDGVLRVARTIADLEGSASIQSAHVAEAVQYRTLDRQPPGG